MTAAPSVPLTVLPRIDAIAPPPEVPGDDRRSGIDRPLFRGQRGENFYALRPYATGDDLRRVHWPSTARLGELMIRQDELPWQGRVTVVADLRGSLHTAESMEQVVSAAASVAAATWTRRSPVRLVTTGGADSGWATDEHHVDLVLDRLAAAVPDRSADLGRALTQLHRSAGGGTLVAITTSAAGPSDLAVLTRLRPRYSLVILVVVQTTAQGGRPVPPEGASLSQVAFGGSGRTASRSARMVVVDAGRPFPLAWAVAMGGRLQSRVPRANGGLAPGLPVGLVLLLVDGRELLHEGQEALEGGAVSE
ncbi:MAG: DUF58 domain-containing protein [Acidimicrobiales bacterium]